MMQELIKIINETLFEKLDSINYIIFFYFDIFVVLFFVGLLI